MNADTAAAISPRTSYLAPGEECTLWTLLGQVALLLGVYPSSRAQKRRCAGQTMVVATTPAESASAQHHQTEITMPKNMAGNAKNKVVNTNTTRRNAVLRWC